MSNIFYAMQARRSTITKTFKHFFVKFLVSIIRCCLASLQLPVSTVDIAVEIEWVV